MSMLFACGRYHNLIERAGVVTLSPAVDAAFPTANLWDGRVSRATRHGTNGANPSITVDLAAFVSIAGTVEIQVRAGERRTVTNTGAGSTVTIQNLATKKYLAAGGASWQAGAVAAITNANTINYQVESATVCQAPVVTLRVVIAGATTCADWPTCNAAAVWGHNLDPGLTVEMRSSTDDFAVSNVLEVTGAIRQPSFLLFDATPSYNRYLRLAFTGTNQATPWYAEVIPCYMETAVTTLGMDHEVTYDWAQVRNDGAYGEPHVYSLATQPRRLAKWRFNMDVAREREVREEVVFRCQGGAYPLLLVPTSTDVPPPVLYGRLDSRWTTTRNFIDIWSTDLTLSEGSAPTPLT